MRATVHDAASKSYAGQFVWLELNFDDARNARFLQSHMAGTPTLFVIDPVDEHVREVWTGSLTPPQLAELLTHAAGAPDGAADEALRRGDAFLGTGDMPKAVAEYERAIVAGGPGWPGREHAIEQLVGGLGNDAKACVTRAAAEAPKLSRQHPFISVAVVGAQCLSSEPSLVGTAAADAVEKYAHEALAMPLMSEDEHYLAYDALHAIRKGAHDDEGARAVATSYLAYTEKLAPTTSPDARMARDQSLLRASVKLGTIDHVIPTLEASERELADANASARLAQAYVAAHRYADAIAACGRGLAKVPGPGGAARLLITRASAEGKTGDVAAATRDLDTATSELGKVVVVGYREAMLGQVKNERAALAKQTK